MEECSAEKKQLCDRIQELQAEALRLHENVVQAEEQVRIKDDQLQAMSGSTTFLDYEQLIQVRSSVLEALRKGKGRGRGSGGIATTSPQYRTAVKVLDEFITGISGVF